MASKDNEKVKVWSVRNVPVDLAERINEQAARRRVKNYELVVPKLREWVEELENEELEENKG